RDFLALRYNWQISRTSVSLFLRSMALKPHRLRYWLNPSDPDCDKKAAKICRLYVSPPAKATVLSLDEKPGIQALRRLQPDRPLRKGKPARLEFEYERCDNSQPLRSIQYTDGARCGVDDPRPQHTLRPGLPRPSRSLLSSRSTRDHHRQHQHQDRSRSPRLAQLPSAARVCGTTSLATRSSGPTPTKCCSRKDCYLWDATLGTHEAPPQ